MFLASSQIRKGPGADFDPPRAFWKLEFEPPEYRPSQAEPAIIVAVAIMR
jgi:hypothetical protein